MSTNLKECPFCGSRKIGRSKIAGIVAPMIPTNFNHCLECRATGPKGFDKLSADGGWNTRAGQEWQPIETAPKDDTIVLGFAAYEDGCYVVAACVFKHGGWVIVGFLSGDDVPIDLTHWMPLPKPPEVGNE